MRWGVLLGLVLVFEGSTRESAALRVVQTASRETPRCASPEDEKQLMGITEQWKQNYNGGNATGVAALYAPDAVYLTQHFVTGVVQGRRAIQAYVQRGVDAQFRVDSIAVLRTECAGEMAYVVDRYTSTNAGQKTMGVNLVVLRRTAGKWQIVAHEAAVPDPATAVQHLDIPKE